VCRDVCSDVVCDSLSHTLEVDLGHTNSPKPSVITPKFHFTAAEARQLLTELKLSSIRQLLTALLQPASTLARPTISQFHVGAVGMATSGDIYVGVNLEFLDMPLNHSVHAEQFLVANLRYHRETELSVVAVNAAPCGHCRQFLSELQCADNVEFLFGDPTGSYKLDQLLPMRFKPQDLLGNDPPPLLLSAQNLPLQFTPGVKEAIAERSTESLLFSKAAQLALQEAQESYCPYSNCPAGIALITTNGEVFGGGYMESCAYNPSMQVCCYCLNLVLLLSASIKCLLSPMWCSASRC
jgi:cytidine deaminase